MEFKKSLMILPILILVFSSGYFLYITYGPGLNLDVDFAGGTQIVAESDTPVNVGNVEDVLSVYSAKIESASGLSGYTVTMKVGADVSSDDVIGTLEENGYVFDSYSVQKIGPSLGETFFHQARIALFAAFAFMAIVIFIVFRKLLPSFYMVLVAVADIVEALVFSQIFGIELSFATFAALLLLVGYSVDSDVLLTMRILKTKEGNVDKRLKGAMKTGLTMTGTTIAVVCVLYFATTSIILRQIASVLLIGLLFDLPNTWMFNAPLLKWYVDKKEKKMVI